MIENSANDEVDFNDAIDSIVCSEERIVESGFKEGYQKGLETGKEEGYKLGLRTGRKYGSEIGYMSGVVQKLIEVEKSDHQKLPEKVGPLLLKLEGILKTLNPENVKIWTVDNDGSYETAKPIFKKLCSLMKIDSKFDKSETLNA